MSNNEPAPSPRAPRDPLLTDEAICRHVRLLVGDDPPPARELWLLWLAPDQRPTDTVSAIDGCPERPAARMVANLFDIVRQVLDDMLPGGSVVVALHRPGSHPANVCDRLWARDLHRAARRAEAPLRGVYLVAGETVRNLPGDAA